jgi:hypothetical protein
MEWISGKKILEKGYGPLDKDDIETNLPSLIRNGKLTVYNRDPDETKVDLEYLKQFFAEIKRLRDEPVTALGVIKGPHTIPNPNRKWSGYDMEERCIKIPEKKGPVKFYRTVTIPDTFIDKHGTASPNKPIPWGVLHKRLVNWNPERPHIAITRSQEIEIDEGFNDKQLLDIIRESKFKKSDLDELLAKENDAEKTESKGSKTTPQQTKRQNNLEQILDKKHPWHSEPLANAVKAWMALYSSREGDARNNIFRPLGGNTKYVSQWLTDNVDSNIGDTTKEHYCFIINPSKQGGPKKAPED